MKTSSLFAYALAVLPISSIVLRPHCGMAQVFLDPKEAGIDFELQGEYAGENCGAQIVALGQGKFRIVGWSHGLPGAVDNAQKTAEGDAELSDGKISFAFEGWKGVVAGGELKGTSEDGKNFILKKVMRQSPTLGAKPPEGAIVLFDGTNTDSWVGGKMDVNGFLNCGIKSHQSFGDVRLHAEFRTPFMPAARGQARGNSGVYLQDRYECQVLDSFGLKGENNEAGGIYSVSKPLLNMCFPPLSWQTYDIDFEGARFDENGAKTKNAVLTVRLNGVLVQDKVEVPKATAAAGRKEGPEPGPIQVQNHSNPVVYRNIWLIEKK
jgi:hypothetical protein